MKRRRQTARTPEQEAKRAAEREAHEASKRECQICERHQCVDARGNMVLHGYTRPGYGFIQGSCFGVGHVDYARGTDALEAYAAQLEGLLADANENVRRYVAGEVTHFTTSALAYDLDERGWIIYDGRKPRMKTVFTSWAPGVSHPSKYSAQLQSAHASAAQHARLLAAELGRVRARIAAWVAP